MTQVHKYNRILSPTFVQPLLIRSVNLLQSTRHHQKLIQSRNYRDLSNRFQRRSICMILNAGAWTSIEDVDNVDLSPRRENSAPVVSFLPHSLVIFPPRPVILARRALDQDFAVLLMRSGYNAVDDLDFIAMDEFQARFWELRSRAWEKYIQNNQGIRQGQITDARYFDFISYAQMLSIQDALRAPKVVFMERFGDDNGNWDQRAVRRDIDLYPDAKSLLKEWRKKVGESIYERLLKTIRRPLPVENIQNHDKLELITDGIKEIYDYMYRCGFCLDIKFEQKMEDMMILLNVEMIGPCTLWGNKMLRRVRGVSNDYDCWCVEQFVKQSNGLVIYDTKLSENSIRREWCIRLPDDTTKNESGIDKFSSVL